MDKIRFIISLTVFLLVTIAFTSGVTAANNTISTQQNTLENPDPWNTRTGISYTTIQAAIDDAQPDDTIIAETGTYTENIIINKKITLKAQGTVTIKAQNTKEPTVTIIANGATITGFTITNGWHGIFVEGENCNITNNKITNNNGYGIHLACDSSNIWIFKNNINNNNGTGIRIEGSSNIISENNIKNNWQGISLEYSSFNTISKNVITNNNGEGIYLLYSLNNNISWNNITNNYYGLYLGYKSDYNKIYRNSFISNKVQATVTSSTGNSFNLGKPTGGNFWSDYTGKDSNGDGFGDTPYIFTGGQDNLPLILPLKILSIDPANGALTVPLTKIIVVTFNWNIFAGPDYNKITVKLPNGVAKTITKWISGNKLYIKATYGWNPGVKFTVTIPKNAIKNKLGKMLASDFKSTFTAAVKVNFIDPANGAVKVPKTKTIIVTFSNNILAGPDYNKITVKLPNGVAKTITKWISGNKLYIKATYGWNPGVKFTVTIPKNAIKNSLGSMLQSDFKSTFTTAS